MDPKLDFQSRWSNSRAQVYLLWAGLTGVGYVATYFYQRKLINPFWFVLAVIGLGYMYHVMPLRLSLMKKIYLAWLVPITFGIVVSGLVFYVDSIAQLMAYLGAFWLAVQAVGFVWNGIVDPPSKWYYIVAAVNLVAGVLLWRVDSLFLVQFLIAAIVSVWSMLMLWIFRAD
jgi:hypothetical protein